MPWHIRNINHKTIVMGRARSLYISHAWMGYQMCMCNWKIRVCRVISPQIASIFFFYSAIVCLMPVAYCHPLFHISTRPFCHCTPKIYYLNGNRIVRVYVVVIVVGGVEKPKSHKICISLYQSSIKFNCQLVNLFAAAVFTIAERIFPSPLYNRCVAPIDACEAFRGFSAISTTFNRDSVTSYA